MLFHVFLCIVLLTTHTMARLSFTTSVLSADSRLIEYTIGSIPTKFECDVECVFDFQIINLNVLAHVTAEFIQVQSFETVAIITDVSTHSLDLIGTYGPDNKTLTGTFKFSLFPTKPNVKRVQRSIVIYANVVENFSWDSPNFYGTVTGTTSDSTPETNPIILYRSFSPSFSMNLSSQEESSTAMSIAPVIKAITSPIVYGDVNNLAFKTFSRHFSFQYSSKLVCSVNGISGPARAEDNTMVVEISHIDFSALSIAIGQDVTVICDSAIVFAPPTTKHQQWQASIRTSDSVLLMAQEYISGPDTPDFKEDDDPPGPQPDPKPDPKQKHHLSTKILIIVILCAVVGGVVTIGVLCFCLKPSSTHYQGIEPDDCQEQPPPSYNEDHIDMTSPGPYNELTTSKDVDAVGYNTFMD